MEITLGKLGSAEPKAPKSLATCSDFSMLWGANLDPSQLLRLCASAIAVCLDHKYILPKYPAIKGNPIEFGHKVLERLLDNGITPTLIYQHGGLCLGLMQKCMMPLYEADESVNFTSQKEDN